MRKIIHALRRFGRDDGGSVVTEAVIVMPLLLWAYVALFAYWDAYRSINSLQKAAYAVSDMISREMTTLTPAYLAGMDTIMERLADQDQNVAMRVTSVYYDLTDKRNEVHWSLSPGAGMTPLTNTTLQAFDSKIPTMSAGDYVIIVEVAATYVPTFEVGVPDLKMTQFIVTRPRFVPRICMQGFTCS